MALLAGFIVLPWHGPSLAFNGARLAADALFADPADLRLALLWVFPLIALAALVLVLWGLAVPERAALASRLAGLLGVVGLAAWLASAILIAVRPGGWSPGLGQWLALAAAGLLVFQASAPSLSFPPWFHAASPPFRGLSVPARLVPYLFLAPGLALYLVWIVAPALYTVYLAFTDWNGVSPAQWVGTANFEHLFLTDRLFRETLANNVRWLLFFVLVPTVAGLALAVAFSLAARPLVILKAAFYAPLAFSFPVIGLVWAWLYNPRLGPLNGLLSLLGVDALPGWLADPQWAIWCIIAAAAWRQVGYVLLLYLAGLRTVDPSLIDAAVVDGAGTRQLVTRVLLPLLGPTTTIVLIISVIDSLRAFDMVQVMTRGGQRTHVLATLMYQEAFVNYRMGYGAAVAVALFALSSLFVGLYLSRVLRAEIDG